MNQSKISISAILPTLNAADLTRRTVERHLAAAAVCGVPFEAIVVDDGSNDGELTKLRTLESLGVRIIENQVNLGRGGAINRGAREARGNYLLILDCDCPPADCRFPSLSRRDAVKADVDVSIGGLRGCGNDFWSRYQDLAVSRREKQFRAGNLYSFTSQNVMVSAACYQQVGGYDERYDRYGFEDRDFFIRLAEAGASFAYTPSAAVIHEDSGISMASLSRKMVEGGRHTARQFAARACGRICRARLCRTRRLATTRAGHACEEPGLCPAVVGQTDRRRRDDKLAAIWHAGADGEGNQCSKLFIRNRNTATVAETECLAYSEGDWALLATSEAPAHVRAALAAKNR